MTYCMALWSADHTFIMVISSPTVPYNTPLVWYAHFIFYSVAMYTDTTTLLVM